MPLLPEQHIHHSDECVVPVEAASAPTFSCPLDIPAISCTAADAFTLADAPAATYSNGEGGNCEISGRATPIRFENNWSQCEGGVITIYYEYVVCGLPQEGTCEIPVEPDDTPPTIDCSALPTEPITLECNATPPDPSIWLDRITASDNCGEAKVELAATAIIDGICITGIIYQYKAVDACGNETPAEEWCSVTYTWPIDGDDPGVSCHPDAGGYLGCNDVTIPSGESLIDDGLITGSDNCGDPEIMLAKTELDDEGCDRSITYYYKAVDACGNETAESDWCSVTFTWCIDREKPVLKCPDPGNIKECDPDLDIDGIPIGVATSVPWTDNCEGAGTTSEYDDGDGVIQDGCHYWLTRTFSYSDKCNNTGTCSVTYEWCITEEPTISVNVPLFNDLGCNPDPHDPPVFVVNDPCNPDVTEPTEIASSIAVENCRVTETWTASYKNKCHEIQSDEVVYTWIEDDIDPELHGVPEDVVVECGGVIPPIPDVTASDNCPGEVRITYNEDHLEFTCEENPLIEKLILRTWTAIDDCGNTHEEAQRIEVARCCEYSGCETAFARGEGVYTCFIGDDEYNGNGNRWGWRNGPLSVGEYEFDIYAGAGQCDISKGALVGTLNVNYTGDDIVVTYNMDEGYAMSETHLYVGCDPYPTGPNGKHTLAPGQYGNQHSLDNATSDEFVLDIGELECTPEGDIYIIAHAVTCAKICCGDGDPDPEPEPGDDVACETAYANGGGIQFCGDDDLQTNRWGWTNPIAKGTSDSWPIYAGAGQCDTDKGTLVGMLHVTRDDAGQVTAEYDITNGTLTDVHMYIGCDKYPKKNDEYTVANGQLALRPAIKEGKKTQMVLTALDCEDVYIIAHAVVCDIDYDKDISMIEPPAPIVVAPDSKKSKKKAKGKSITAPDVGQQSGFTTEVNVFPNPASSYLFVQFDDNSEGEHRVQLHDALGRFIKEYRLDVRPGERIRLDLPNLVQNGMYYLRVHNREQLKVVPIVVSKNVFDMRRN